MKNGILLAITTIVLSLPLTVIAAVHSGHGGGGNPAVAHEEVVDGVTATFKVQTMADAMKAMGMEMPKGVKETHHVSVAFKDVRTGKSLTEGTVAVKIQNPDKSSQSKEMNGMHGHFGADFEFSKPGRYGVMCKFVTKDNRTRQSKFWYQVK